MNSESNIQESNLKAILQQHFRRFIASIEFVVLDNEDIVIDVFFGNGEKERISKGNIHEYFEVFLNNKTPVANSAS